MGIRLIYESLDRVPADVSARLQREAETLEPERGWWTESLELRESPERGGGLAGATKIMLVAYDTSLGHRTVDPVDDMAMALRDVRFIVGHLKRWSRSARIRWRVSWDEGDLGTIRWGFLSIGGHLRLLLMTLVVCYLARTPFLGPVRTRALLRHGDRWE